VLDIACGTGFGTAMLASAGAHHVTGVDLDIATVAAARKEYGGTHRSFLVADGTCLPFATASFDVVTSFETLEHISTSEAFLAELRRVLTPDGLLVLSTPNRDYTEMNGNTCTNPHHVQEYTASELKQLLLRHFSRVELLGQRLAPEYRLSPFYADHQRMEMGAGTRLRLIWWKAQNRLPFPVKDSLSRLFSGHSFYPGEDSYLFSEEQIDAAPVLVAKGYP
jgi:SAM-dependent methyltransferase